MNANLVFATDPLTPALIVSLLSVGVLVGLFFYLNHYTKRDYFSIWGTAWLFYALWLTLRISTGTGQPNSFSILLNRCCIATSAAFLLWGSFRFMSIPVRHTLMGSFLAFLYVWSFVSAKLLTNSFHIRVALFFLLSLASLSAALSFYRVRRRQRLVGATLLSAGFLLWSVWLGSYPFCQRDERMITSNLFLAASLQLFIAVSMIILVLEEVRGSNTQVQEEIREVQCEKEALQLKILSAEVQFRSLFEQSQLSGDLQKVYDELRQTQQMVVQQERLRAVGEMASGIAHDINNSLTPIIGYTDLLLEGKFGLTEASRKYLQSVKIAAGDIEAMISRMRQFYRRRAQDEPSEPVDLNTIVREVIEMTRPRWRDIPQREGILVKIITDLRDDVPIISVNPCELREALTNLLLNAVDAMPKGGNLTIATRWMDQALAGQNTKRQALVEVTDTGKGMDEVTRQRCLEPFFTTKGPRGTGLGLSMVYGMVRRHHGSVDIQSAPGKGTVVRLALPTADTMAVQVAPCSKSGPSAALRILCVDDDERVGSLLKDFLGTLDHVVDMADNGAKALERFHSSASSGQPFQVVITDLGMPNMDGREVARRIKETSPQTPVIMLTGWAGFMEGDQNLPRDVDALLSKPPKMEALKELLAKVSLGQRLIPATA